MAKVKPKMGTKVKPGVGITATQDWNAECRFWLGRGFTFGVKFGFTFRGSFAAHLHEIAASLPTRACVFFACRSRSSGTG